MIIKILLDTNFLILPLTLGRNIDSEIQKLIEFRSKYYYLSSSLRELELMKKKKPSLNFDFKLIPKIWPNIEMIKSSENASVDDLILKKAIEERFVVATNDMGLKRKLTKRGLPVIYLRQKSLLTVDAPMPLSEYLVK